MYVCVDIPCEYTRNAFDADRTMDALEPMKNELFKLHCSFDLENDPLELNNVIGQQQEQARSLKDRVELPYLNRLKAQSF